MNASSADDMEAPARVSEAVRRFIAEYVRSVDDLRVLAACVQSRDRWLDPINVSVQAGVKVDFAQRALESLAKWNLLDVRIGEKLRYRFHPGTPELETTALEVCELYRRHRRSIARLVNEAAG